MHIIHALDHVKSTHMYMMRNYVLFCGHVCLFFKFYTDCKISTFIGPNNKSTKVK